MYASMIVDITFILLIFYYAHTHGNYVFFTSMPNLIYCQSKLNETYIIIIITLSIN